MKILWVKAGKLWPVDTGGKIRSFNILRHLARNHEVTLLSYYGGARDIDYETEISKQLPGAETIYTATPEGTVAQAIDYILRLPSAAPYAVRKFTHPKVCDEVARRLKDGNAEVAVCDFLSASLNFPEASTTPVVLFQHNVESMLWRRMAETEQSAFRKLSYRIEARKMAAYEARMLQRFRHVIAVSDHDCKEMLALAPGCTVTVVPTGVDTEQYRPAPSVSGTPPRIVFTGSMDWEPNIDAVEYFCRDVSLGYWRKSQTLVTKRPGDAGSCYLASARNSLKIGYVEHVQFSCLTHLRWRNYQRCEHVQYLQVIETATC